VALISDCFLPSFDEDIQKWIIKGEIYFRNSVAYKDNGQDWILLNAAFFQEDKDRKIRLTSDFESFLVKSSDASKLLKHLNSPSKELNSRIEIPQYYYLFCGEASWSDNIDEKEEYRDISTKGKKFSINYPYFWYSWESYHSDLNDIGTIPLISKSMARQLNLKLNLGNFSFCDNTGSQATMYIGDDYSHFFYIRKDLLMQYLEKNSLQMVYYEFSAKYGNWGEFDHTKYNPQYKDFWHYSVLKN